jgi:hypothetical protein
MHKNKIAIKVAENISPPLAPGCRLTDLPTDSYIVEQLRLLDIDFYRNHKHDGIVADLKDYSNADIIEHFIQRGRIDGRIYNKRILDFLDPDYYIKKYPDLGLSSHSEAQLNWLYQGIFEGKFPNGTTSKMLNAEIHLFQMGKVGSKSIQSSILRGHPDKLIPHLHFAQEMLLTYEDSYYSYPEIIRLNKKGIKFIAGVRDPVGRVISGWIQAFFEPESSITFSETNERIINAKTYADLYANEMKTIVNWFDHNFYCGIDVYNTDFNLDKGFSLITNGVHKLLVYKIDKLDGLWEEISEFTGLPLEPTHDNLSKDKGEIAKKLLDNRKKVRLPYSLVQEISETRYMKHFFSSTEIEEFIRTYAET